MKSFDCEAAEAIYDHRWVDAADSKSQKDWKWKKAKAWGCTGKTRL